MIVGIILWNGLMAEYKRLAKQTNSTKALFWFNLQYKPTSTKLANSNRSRRVREETRTILQGNTQTLHLST